MEPIIKINLSDFNVGVQEIILFNRYGRMDEEQDDPNTIRRDLYRAFQAQLAKNEIRFTCELATKGLRFEILVSRVYNYNGEIYRVVYPASGALNVRKNELKEDEKKLIQLAGFLIEMVCGIRPLGLKTIFHELSSRATIDDLMVKRSHVYETEMLSQEEGKRLLSEFLNKVAENINVSDMCLPECTKDQRGYSDSCAFGKCFYSCRVRNNCYQIDQIKKTLVIKMAAENGSFIEFNEEKVA